MAPTIHLVRHAQGLHNVSSEHRDTQDPRLTSEGELQCERLRKSFPYMDQVTHLVASPMRRTIQTCMYSFRPVVAKGKQIVLLPELQEVGGLPCNTGSDPASLDREFGDVVDLSHVEEGWNRTSPGSPFEDGSKLQLLCRARKVRGWLHQLARSADDDAHIVMVSHGNFINVILRDWEPFNRRECWWNAEFRSFQFRDLNPIPTLPPDLGYIYDSENKAVPDMATRRFLRDLMLVETEESRCRDLDPSNFLDSSNGESKVGT